MVTELAAGQTTAFGPRKLAILLFVASESIVFLSFIAMYVRGQAYTAAPTAQQSLSAARMIPFSAALWASSATIGLAHRRLDRDDQQGMRWWLLATVVLGAVFLGGELSEWLALFRDQVTAASNIWSTTFFTLTGIHGLHVVVGLLTMLGLIWSSFYHPVGRGGESSLGIFAVYWHFVDGMWVLIFGVVYVWSAYLGG